MFSRIMKDIGVTLFLFFVIAAATNDQKLKEKVMKDYNPDALPNNGPTKVYI